MKTINELNELKANALNSLSITKGYRVVVGMASCGIAAGAKPVISTLKKEVEAKGLKDVEISPAGCIGMCVYEPIVEVFAPGQAKVTYIHVDSEKAARIVSEHLGKGVPVTDYMIPDNKGGVLRNLNDVQFYKKQKRVVLKNCGLVNPENIDNYIALDGYQAMAKVLTKMTRDEVIDLMKASGLRGRGGAGFPPV